MCVEGFPLIGLVSGGKGEFRGFGMGMLLLGAIVIVFVCVDEGGICSVEIHCAI